MLHAAWRIDDDEIVFVRSANFPELRYELSQVGAMAEGATVEVILVRSPIFFEVRYELVNAAAPRPAVGNLFRDWIVIGQLQFPLVFPIPFTTIPEVPRERQLVQVEIKTGDPLAGFKQGHNDVHGKCGFATAALLVPYDDDVRRRLHAAGWYDRGTHYWAKPALGGEPLPFSQPVLL